MDHAHIKGHQTFRDCLLLTLIQISVAKNKVWHSEFVTLIHSWRFLFEEHVNQLSVPPAVKVSGELVNRHFASLVSNLVC